MNNGRKLILKDVIEDKELKKVELPSTNSDVSDIIKWVGNIINVNKLNYYLYKHIPYKEWIVDNKNIQMIIDDKKQGNIFYARKQYQNAFDTYTKALLLLCKMNETNSEIVLLKQLHYNRSLCLFRLQQYQLAVISCQMALMIDCKYEKAQLHLEKLKMSININESISNDDELCKHDHCKILYDQDKGRYIVYENNISRAMNDRLVIEKPIASVPLILSDGQFNRCNYCIGVFQQLNGKDVNFPCHRCGITLYCSRSCFKLDEFNHFCGQKHIYWLDERCLLAAKLIHNSKECKKEFQNHLKETRTVDLINLTFESYFLSLLQYNRIHQEINDKRFSVLDYLTVLSQIHTNAIALHRTRSTNSDSRWETSIPINYGFGIYRFASKLNHSCDPNCIVYFRKNNDQLYVSNIKDIKANDELTISYGVTVCHQYEERQKILRRNFCFQCSCVACRKGLPKDFICDQCKNGLISVSDIECFKCKTPISQNSMNRMKYFLSKYNSKSFSISLNSLEQTISDLQELEKITAKYSLLKSRIYDELAKFMIQLDNKQEAIQYLNKSVDICVSYFGENSVEVAREEYKLASIMHLYSDKNSLERKNAILKHCIPILIEVDGDDESLQTYLL